MRPMLATKGTHVPAGADWQHEVKWDGMRTLVECIDSRLRLWSRNENDVSVSFPELADPPLGTRDFLLDAEVVAFADGVPSFGALADRMHVANARRAKALAEVNPVTALVFDVLRLDGKDLTGLPLAVRRERLEALGMAEPQWQAPPVYDDGSMLLEATRQQGLEGIVSKRLDSRYLPGARSKHWLKFAHRVRGSYVIGGWRLETDSTSRLGAVLVGQPTAEGLIYRGRVGSGLGGVKGPRVKALLEGRERGSSPFADEVPRLDALGTIWVEPMLVVEVESLGLSSQLRLRQPSFQGVRTDLSPEELR